MNSGITSALWFVAVLAMIPVALWLLKRTPMGGAGAFGSAAGANLLRQVGALALAPGQRIVTIEVGQGEQRRWLVLGVTAQNITTLHEMAPQAEPLAETAPAASFAQMLNRLGRGQGAQRAH
jgi:flagellar protein FliO/FliZ